MADSIRRAGPGDAAALARLIACAFQEVARRFALTPANAPTHPSNCRPEWVAADLGRGVSYFLISRDETGLGCVALESASSELCYLERLAVHPSARRRGLGARLVGHALAEARSRGAGKVSVGIIAAQSELVEWYRRLGFLLGEARRFEHLPFEVRFMTCDLGGDRRAPHPDR
jgi:N-acetylglutamate synthase-like GNAT family acetyltransferase